MENNNRLYVGNLNFRIDEESLRATFEQCGTVSSVKLITDQYSGRSKGFAFVEMSTAEEAQKAIEAFDGQDYEGRNVKVNIAKPMEKRPRNRY